MGCTKPKNAFLALVSLRFSTAVDVITDVMIIALPMSLAWRVRLPLRTKLALVGVFSLGGFIVAFSIIRIIFTNEKKRRPEISWLNLWSVVEASVACIVCNLAPFKTLFTGKSRDYTSDPYHYGQKYAKHGKPVYEHELSSSGGQSAWSGHAKIPINGQTPDSTYPPHPALYPPKAKHGKSFANGNGQKFSGRRFQTRITSNPNAPGSSPRSENSGIVVTRELERKETAADQITLGTDDGVPDEKMRTMWTDRNSVDSLEEILSGRHVAKKSLADVYGRHETIGRAR